MRDPNIAHVPHEAEARRKGPCAGRRGSTGADNPYENDSREARAWIWPARWADTPIDGRAKRLTRLEEPPFAAIGLQGVMKWNSDTGAV
jgi:hypothetical protein